MKKHDLLVIASYPPQGTTHDKAIVGGASYSKNTLVHLLKAVGADNLSITVLAEALPGVTSEYMDEDIKVKRIWKKGSLTSFTSLLKAVLGSPTKDVLLTFEFSMFGGMLSLLPLPLFLLLLKLFGKRLSIVIHQVIPSAASMSGHLNLKAESRKTSLYSILFSLFYRSLFVVSDQLIVFEDEFKRRLQKYGSSQKITVIPHGVESFKTSLTQDAARIKLDLPLNKKIVLCFGFLAWYKGTDWCINLFAEHKEELKDSLLIIAGGPNQNHMGKPFYQDYIQKLETKADAAGIRITGFVAENELPLYFTAADLILLPYRSLMAASGPLSLAFSFEKPFLISSELAPYMDTADFKSSLTELKIDYRDVTFPLTKEAAGQITKACSKPLSDQLQKLALCMQEKRSWESIGKDYAKALQLYV